MANVGAAEHFGQRTRYLPLNILLATSEATPFAKTGGLADVCGALPPRLSELGHSAAVILPAYRACLESGQPIETTDIEFQAAVGQKSIYGRVLRSRLPNSDVPVFLIEQPHYFDRPALYGEKHGDYGDNSERFVFFARAVCEVLPRLGMSFDVVHCNDWTTGLIPVFLKTAYADTAPYDSLATLFTIHNMAYQGAFWHWDMLLTGLDWKYFNWRQLECYGQLNFLKAGLVFSDAINTVSPRYAEEIQSPPLGCGLEGVLQDRRAVLSGIVNGVDYSVWNPEIDPHIAASYHANSVLPGKAECKKALQREFRLPELEAAPLIGFISRLVEQKGVDLLLAVLNEWAPRGQAQWVILGSGESRWEDALTEIARRFPQSVAFKAGYNEGLSHRIEAGADFFVMPSKYEPCGLNQLYSLKYGAVPVVRSTGGLFDTVVNANETNIAQGTATGFAFHDYSALALNETLTRACETYRQQRALYDQIQRTGMLCDWSWGQSAKRYLELYESIRLTSRQPVGSAS